MWRVCVTRGAFIWYRTIFFVLRVWRWIACLSFIRIRTVTGSYELNLYYKFWKCWPTLCPQQHYYYYLSLSVSTLYATLSSSAARAHHHKNMVDAGTSTTIAIYFLDSTLDIVLWLLTTTTTTPFRTLCRTEESEEKKKPSLPFLFRFVVVFFIRRNSDCIHGARIVSYGVVSIWIISRNSHYDLR